MILDILAIRKMEDFFFSYEPHLQENTNNNLSAEKHFVLHLKEKEYSVLNRSQVYGSISIPGLNV